LVKIRLKRMGTTKRPFYRLVVADSRSPRDGRFIESLGHYDPLPRPAAVSIDAERVREWLRRGARPSDSARDLLVAQGILAADPRRRAPLREPEVAARAGAEGAAEAAAPGEEAASPEAEAEVEGPAAAAGRAAQGTEDQ
jgi:small subunit ribosomal protein S16